jgi:hypothetical protein
MEQLVARRAHNPKVIGSSPVPATNEASDENQGLFFIINIINYLIYNPKVKISLI